MRTVFQGTTRYFRRSVVTADKPGGGIQYLGVIASLIQYSLRLNDYHTAFSLAVEVQALYPRLLG
jgi:hypothetical protein